MSLKRYHNNRRFWAARMSRQAPVTGPPTQLFAVADATSDVSGPSLALPLANGTTAFSISVAWTPPVGATHVIIQIAAYAVIRAEVQTFKTIDTLYLINNSAPVADRVDQRTGSISFYPWIYTSGAHVAVSDAALRVRVPNTGSYVVPVLLIRPNMVNIFSSADFTFSVTKALVSPAR